MKTLFKSLGGIVVIVLLAAVILFFLAWSRVPDMLADSLSKKMNVRVEIDDMHLSWNAIGIEKFVIGNPKGSILSKAFSAETITVETALPNYLKDNIVIEEIALDDIYLGLEFDSASSTKGNWTTLMANLQASQDSSQKESKKHKDTSVLIKKIVLTNLKVDVVYRQGDQKVKHLKTIKRLELTNISSQGGFPVDQLMNSVLGEMLKSVFVKENLKNMLDNLLQNPTKAPQGLLDTFKGIFP